MRARRIAAVCVVALAYVHRVFGEAAVDERGLASKVTAVFKAKCSECHGPQVEKRQVRPRARFEEVGSRSQENRAGDAREIRSLEAGPRWRDAGRRSEGGPFDEKRKERHPSVDRSRRPLRSQRAEGRGDGQERRRCPLTAGCSSAAPRLARQFPCRGGPPSHRALVGGCRRRVVVRMETRTTTCARGPFLHAAGRGYRSSCRCAWLDPCSRRLRRSQSLHPRLASMDGHGHGSGGAGSRCLFRSRWATRKEKSMVSAPAAPRCAFRWRRRAFGRRFGLRARLLRLVVAAFPPFCKSLRSTFPSFKKVIADAKSVGGDR
jgi:hypothetical protein